jgi:neural Wiskott-Aldrich syndrome protein
VKKQAPRTSVGNPNYGGPGSFTPLSNPPTNLHEKNHSESNGTPLKRTSSGAHLPTSLLPSNSLARLSLYNPPYELQRRQDNYNVDDLANDMSELGMMTPRRHNANVRLLCGSRCMFDANLIPR